MSSHKPKYEFEWDENKEKINISNHGIDFKIAGEIINSEGTVRWVVPPEKWDKKFDDFIHNFSEEDVLKDKIRYGLAEFNGNKPLSDKDVEDVFKSMTSQDIVRDHWVGIYEDKYYSIFTVFRLPKIRIISARRARDSEVEQYNNFKKLVDSL